MLLGIFAAGCCNNLPMLSAPVSGTYWLWVFSIKKRGMAMPSVAATTASGDTRLLPLRSDNSVEFQCVTALRSGRTVARRTTVEEIRPLLVAARTAIGADIASETVVTRVVTQHPDSAWTFVRNGRLVGGLAMLMLNGAGLEALLSDSSIDFRDPASHLLADRCDSPAAIYIWGVLAPALAIEGVAEVMLRLRSPQYDSADIYAFRNTVQGARFQERLGFQVVPGHPRNLYRLVRFANRLH
jgi:hypothetical protein